MQPAAGSAAFKVAIDGGDGPDTADGPAPAETGAPAITVGEAAAGSGMVSVDPGGVILAGSTGNTLTFTYTLVGDITTSLREFRVEVDPDWTKPIAGGKASDKKGTYEITHKRSGSRFSTIIEKKDPIEFEMLARVVSGASPVKAGDTIEFEYQNADAPAEAETSIFTIEFDGETVGTAKVLVQAAEASQLVLTVPSSVSVDEGAAPAKVTVMIQDANGDSAAADSDIEVIFETSSKAGAFAETATGAGEAELTITVEQGADSMTVWYSDSAAGTTAKISVSDTADNLTGDDKTIAVSSDTVSIGPVSFMISDDKDGAMDGDTVTVTADISGAPSETPTFTIGSIVMGGGIDMADANGDGTYTGSHTLAAGSPEGSHNVTVHVGDDLSMDAPKMLVVDNTMPEVTITAPAADTTVANGDTVTISATVVGATSVTADVSALDSTQTNVPLTMGAAGSYSVDVAISDDNEAVNGSKTITVTAADAAGNSANSSGNGYVGQQDVLHLDDTDGSEPVPCAVGC